MDTRISMDVHSYEGYEVYWVELPNWGKYSSKLAVFCILTHFCAETYKFNIKLLYCGKTAEVCISY